MLITSTARCACNVLKSWLLTQLRLHTSLGSVKHWIGCQPGLEQTIAQAMIEHRRCPGADNWLHRGECSLLIMLGSDQALAAGNTISNRVLVTYQAFIESHQTLIMSDC